MQTADSSPENKRYNAQINLLDGLYEFHPEYFTGLSKTERKVMEQYYLLNQETPDNVFEYRIKLLANNPTIGEHAELAFQHILTAANIKDFRY